MNTQEFNTSEQLTKTREALDKPIGLILLGMTPEVMTGDARNALIASQGAVRAANIADKMVAVAADASSVGPKDFVRHDDPVFKWINSDKDADIVKRGQNLWLTAQMSLNYQILSTQDIAALPLNTGFTDSVSASAAVVLNEAAAIMDAQNQTGAANKLTALAKTIAPATKGDVLEDKVAGDIKFTRLTLDKPLGDLMVGMLNIDPQVKNALLMGQAAVRAMTLAEKAEDFVKDGQKVIDTHRNAGTTIEPRDSGAVAFDDQIFKFVGSPRDPAGLQLAQGLWMSAQMYFNYQVGAVKRVIDGEPKAAPLSNEFSAGLKQQAAAVLMSASKILKETGHDAAAGKMEALSLDFAAKGNIQNVIAPSRMLTALIHFDHNVRGNTALEEKLRQLVTLTTVDTNSGGTAPAPKPQ